MDQALVAWPNDAVFTCAAVAPEPLPLDGALDVVAALVAGRRGGPTATDGGGPVCLPLQDAVRLVSPVMRDKQQAELCVAGGRGGGGDVPVVVAVVPGEGAGRWR